MFNGVTIYGIIGPFSDFQPQDAFQYIVYPWFMLLLFVISVMTARFELENKSSKEFMRIRTRKYLVPSTIGLLVFGWVLGYFNMAISGAFNQMTMVPKPILFLIMCVSGSGPLWYIQMLWLFSLILIFIRKIEKDRLYEFGSRTNVIVLFLFTFVIYGSAQVLNTPIIVVYRFGIYLSGFLIGYFVLSHDEVMERLEKCWLMLLIFAIILCIAFICVFWGQSYADHEVLDTILCNVYAWIGTIGVLAFMKKWGNFENPLSKWMSSHSWGLYIFHYLPIAAVSWYLCGDSPDRVPPYVYLSRIVPGCAPLIIYVLVATAGFAGAFILYEIISRIPVLNWCILGMGQKGKRD